MYNYQDYNVLAHTYNFSLATLSSVFAKQNFQLIKGDEFIRSIFKRSTEKVLIEGEDQNCGNIMEALEQAFNRDLRPVIKMGFTKGLDQPQVKKLASPGMAQETEAPKETVFTPVQEHKKK